MPKELRTFWPDLFETLQWHVAQSPDTAQAVRTTLERLRGEDGSQLYRLLWGYSPQQLAEGDATNEWRRATIRRWTFGF